MLDTNSRMISRELLSLGYLVGRHVTLGDAPGALRALLDEVAGDYRVVVTTGGLGPTADDRVREEVAALAGAPLVAVEGAVEPLVRLWQRYRGGEPPAFYLKQAFVPQGAQPLENRAGTAWGFACRIPGDRQILCLPGPPGEARSALLDGGGSALLAASIRSGERLAFEVFHTSGEPESAIEPRVRDLLEDSRNPRFGIIASRMGVSVSAMAYPEPGGRTAQEVLAAASRELIRRLGPLCFGRGEDTPATVVLAALEERNATLACAESCTGGRLAAALTAVPGCSGVFEGGWVCYANAAKERDLGVSADLLQRFGAVSAEVALAMAEGARARAGTDWAVATTGVAGPGGGTPAKPVGTIWIGLAGPAKRGAILRRAYARAGRASVQEQGVGDALEALRREILGHPSLPDRA